MRENCTSGSAQGASGNGRSYCEMRKDMKHIFILAILLCGCSDLKIDKCLDDGGSFNYEKCVCDFESNHQSKSTHNC